MSQARGTVSVDDDRVRVTTWTFEAAGTATGRHRHEFDYVIVPITGGTFTVTDLVDAGYVSRTRVGRRNRYELDPNVAMRHPSQFDHQIGELLDLLGSASNRA